MLDRRWRSNPSFCRTVTGTEMVKLVELTRFLSSFRFELSGNTEMLSGGVFLSPVGVQ